MDLRTTDPDSLADRSRARLAMPLLELKAEGEGGTFEGYGAVFQNIDGHRDVIEPGAFRSTLAKHRRDGSWPAMLMQHNPELPIGEWESMAEDARGLTVKGRLWIDGPHPDPVALRAYRAMKSNAKPVGLSIGYTVEDAAIDQKRKVRLLKAVELAEVSVVMFPANTAARITRVKAAGQIATIREFEAFLRDAGGFSRAAAAKIALHGFKALDARDGHGATTGTTDPRDEDGLAAIRALLERNIATLTG